MSNRRDAYYVIRKGYGNTATFLALYGPNVNAQAFWVDDISADSPTGFTEHLQVFSDYQTAKRFADKFGATVVELDDDIMEAVREARKHYRRYHAG